MQPPPAKWEHLQSDLGEWKHPVDGTKHKFVIFQDQGTRLGQLAYLFKVENAEMATGDLLYQKYLDHWEQRFGRPKLLEVDPEGAWMATALRERLQGRGSGLSRSRARLTGRSETSSG